MKRIFIIIRRDRFLKKFEETARALLRDAGVLVSPGYQFGIQGDGHFRICYARDEKEWTRALDRMVAVLDGLARERGLGTIG